MIQVKLELGTVNRSLCVDFRSRHIGDVMCALEMIVKKLVERKGTLEDGFVVGDVVGGNPKSQGGMGRVDLVVIHTKIGDHGKQIRIHKHVIPAGRDLSIGSDASVFPWGLSPYLGFGPQINPPFPSQQVAQNGDVPRLGVKVPTHASRPPGVGRYLLADGVPDQVSLLGLGLVGVTSSVVVRVIDKHVVASSYVNAE